MMTDADYDVFSLELNDRDDREETSELERNRNRTKKSQKSHAKKKSRSYDEFMIASCSEHGQIISLVLLSREWSS